MSKYVAITEPTPEPLALLKTVRDLRENVEILTGQRGERSTSVEDRLARIEQTLDDIEARLRKLET